MSGSYTPEQLAMLEAQIAHFASDDHIRREVAVWRDSTPEERLAVAAEMCRVADQLLAQVPADQLERALAREPLPPDSIAMLEAIRKLPR
jgi:hypothetical protein